MEQGLAGMGRDLWGIGGSEGNEASVSPACSSPREPAGALDLNLSPLGPPPAMLHLSSAPHQGLFQASFFFGCCCGSVFALWLFHLYFYFS